MFQFDQELIRKLKQQDHSAFNTFYLKTVDMFSRYIEANYFITHQDAQDIISDFYVKFREGAKKYDEKQSFSGYFWTIFKNLLKDYFKKNQDIPFTNIGTEEQDTKFEETLIEEEDIGDILQRDFEFSKIQKAMKEIDDGSKDIIYWKFIEEKSNEEIEILLGISNDNVRQRLSRAIKQLKSRLENPL
ncbi:MAG: sigma-70 family RNA polymerase sigma factor [Candidatus Absconditabacteria bacterium]|nr:sigma-70 family RNA polymerase sigma factor [Candidatus Absconditabacteria bacterium]